MYFLLIKNHNKKIIVKFTLKINTNNILKYNIICMFKILYIIHHILQYNNNIYFFLTFTFYSKKS